MRMSFVKKLLHVIVFSLLITFTAKPAPAEGTTQKAPNFSLPSINGGIVELSKSKGKVVLINYWATWCGPCIREIPDLNEIYKEFQSQGFEIIGISVDEKESTVKEFVKGTKINYPVVMGNDNVVKSYGGLRGIPKTFIVDRQGHIRKEYLGSIDKNQVKSQLKTLLSEK